MSELFRCRVTSVSKTSAKIQVVSVHPDSGPPRGETTFAMMLVYDPIMSSGYGDFSRFTHLESCPLAQEMDRDNYLDEAWIKNHANAFLAKATVKKGVMEVFPTHPAWIEHLRKGMSWDTAAYSVGQAEPAEARAPTPPSEGPAAHSRNPADGFRVGAPSRDEYKHLTEAFLAIHGPNRYVADPILTEPAQVVQATKTMLGQPVLIVPKRGPTLVGTIVGHFPEYLYTYYEDGAGGSGGGAVSYTDIRSIGRAWLKEKTLPTLVEKPAAKPAKKEAKKDARKAAKKPAKKPAKKAAKTSTKKSAPKK